MHRFFFLPFLIGACGTQVVGFLSKGLLDLKVYPLPIFPPLAAAAAAAAAAWAWAAAGWRWWGTESGGEDWVFGGGFNIHGRWGVRKFGDF